MTSAFPKSPYLAKGALVVYPTGRLGDQAQIVTFQYNPESLRRGIEDRAPSSPQGDAGAERAEAMRLQGPPKETLNVSIVLDAADQLEHPDQNPSVRDKGLLPALFLVETLLYPTPEQARETQRLAEDGEAQTSPLEKPSVLAVWGEHRVVPVKITSFSVTEEAFDRRLNPIRAKIDLGMTVLTDTEVEDDRVEWKAYSSYQQQKQNLAGMHSSGGGEDEGRVREVLPS